MSTETPAIPAPDEALILGGCPGKEHTLEYLTDPARVTELVYRYQRFTDEAYAELVNDIGWRAAIVVLRMKALSGDIKALDLYLKICKEDKESRKRKRSEKATPQLAGLVQSPRQKDDPKP